MDNLWETRLNKAGQSETGSTKYLLYSAHNKHTYVYIY